MKNPIGKFKREKLEEINLEAKGINEKLNKIDSFIEDFETIKEQVNVLFSFMVEENTEPTIEERKQIEEQNEKMQKEVQEQLEQSIQNALINLVNKKENQEAIMNFANQFSQGMKGEGQLAGFVDAEGQPNWMGIIEHFMKSKGMGGIGTVPTPQGQPSQRKSRSTGY